ncbi:hypothetical protein C8J56DRAFT_1127350 [Mycena floridula]|nr:hypothetical protein C8J56DRAFT_1127350 [Mycena floridula]
MSLLFVSDRSKSQTFSWLDHLLSITKLLMNSRELIPFPYVKASAGLVDARKNQEDFRELVTSIVGIVSPLRSSMPSTYIALNDRSRLLGILGTLHENSRSTVEWEKYVRSASIKDDIARRRRPVDEMRDNYFMLSTAIQTQRNRTDTRWYRPASNMLDVETPNPLILCQTWKSTLCDDLDTPEESDTLPGSSSVVASLADDQVDYDALYICRFHVVLQQFLHFLLNRPNGSNCPELKARYAPRLAAARAESDERLKCYKKQDQNSRETRGLLFVSSWMTFSDPFRRVQTSFDIREKIKKFLISQRMIKGHFGEGPGGEDDRYSDYSSSSNPQSSERRFPSDPSFAIESGFAVTQQNSSYPSNPIM